MVGGAEAEGSPNDTAVVYTPALHEYDDKGQRRVYVWNVTLPQHFFSRAPVDPDQRESHFQSEPVMRMLLFNGDICRLRSKTMFCALGHTHYGSRGIDYSCAAMSVSQSLIITAPLLHVRLVTHDVS